MAQGSPVSDAVGETPTTSATLAELMSALSLGGSVRLTVDAEDGGLVLSTVPRPAANPWLDQHWVRDLAAYYAWAQSPPAEAESSDNASSYPPQFVLDEQYLRDYYFAAFYERVMERGLEPLESTEDSTSEQPDSDTAAPTLSPSVASTTPAVVPPVVPLPSPAASPVAAPLAAPGPAAIPIAAVPAPPAVASVPGPAVAPVTAVPAPPAASVAPAAPATAHATVQTLPVPAAPGTTAPVPPTPPAAGPGSTSSTDAVDGSDDDNDPTVRWYCITRGRCVGVFARWETVAPLVLGVPNACFARHPTRQSAYASFLLAHNQGHVGVVA